MRLFFLFLVLFSLSVQGAPLGLKSATMLSGATATGAGSTAGPASSGEKSFQAVVSGTGAVSATVEIQVSNDVSTLGWVVLGTITLSGTTTATDGFVSEGAWKYYRVNVSAISGTNATVTVISANE